MILVIGATGYSEPLKKIEKTGPRYLGWSNDQKFIGL